jgi:hypothetical protein
MPTLAPTYRGGGLGSCLTRQPDSDQRWPNPAIAAAKRLSRSAQKCGRAPCAGERRAVTYCTTRPPPYYYQTGKWDHATVAGATRCGVHCGAHMLPKRVSAAEQASKDAAILRNPQKALDLGW